MLIIQPFFFYLVLICIVVAVSEAATAKGHTLWQWNSSHILLSPALLRTIFSRYILLLYLRHIGWLFSYIYGKPYFLKPFINFLYCLSFLSCILKKTLYEYIQTQLKYFRMLKLYLDLNSKGIFHAQMSTIKDRKGRDLTEAEDIKKRWQEHRRTVQKRSSSPR